MAALKIAAFILAGAMAAFLFSWLKVPAGLLLGPCALGMVFARLDLRCDLKRTPSDAAHAVIGCVIGIGMTPDMLDRILSLGPLVAVFSVFNIALACFAGRLTARWTGVPREVAIWGFLPGMAGLLIAISERRGLDSRMVAFIQVLRLAIIIALLVLASAFLTGQKPAVLPARHDALPGLPVVLICVLSCSAARLLPRLPSAGSVIPLLLASTASLAGIPLVLPGWLLTFAFGIVGVQIGMLFTPSLMVHGLSLLPRLAVTTLAMVFMSMASGLLLIGAGNIDIKSALLAAVPGGADWIVLIAMGSGADVALVVALQTFRLFTIALLGPTIADLVARDRRKGRRA